MLVLGWIDIAGCCLANYKIFFPEEEENLAN
jgi:hypothetical protein